MVTDAEWLASDDPRAMLDFLTARPQQAAATNVRRISNRKLRLFACAVARLQGPREDAELLRAADDAEEYAETGRRVTGRRVSDRLDMNCADAASAARYAAGEIWGTASTTRQVAQAEKASLLRDIAGNPFRPVALPKGQPCPRCNGTGTLWRSRTRGSDCPQCKGEGYQRCPWLTPDVLALAQAAYLERDPATGHLDPARLAVLADALEEAGCADEAVLSHLRSPGPHVRGCWALDLVLSKE